MLKVRGITYRLNQRHLIEDITLDFHPGKLTAIIGPNGSGKSTLLKSIAHIWSPTHGSVSWKGKDFSGSLREWISRTVSSVPQSTYAPFEFSVWDMVAMGRFSHGKGGEDQEVIAKALQRVDAWHLKDRLVNHLSSGERQRVYIARALATESPVLLLDEPTTSLDIGHQMEIWELMRELTDEGKCVIVAHHDLNTVEKRCDEAVIIHAGRCVGAGSAASVMASPVIEEVFGVVKNERGEFVLPAPCEWFSDPSRAEACV